MKTADRDLRLGKLVGELYDAALDDTLWSGLARRLADAFDSTSAVVKTHGGGNQVQLLEVTENLIVPPRDQTWADHWHRNDLWVERSMAFGMSRIVTNLDLMSNAELEKTAFYHEWLRYLDIYHVVGTAFRVDPDTVGVIGIHRPRDGVGYENEDRERVERFLPHLNRSLRISRQLHGASIAQSATLDALDRLDIAIIVVDARCCVLHANRRGEHMLTVETALRVRRGQLCLEDSARNSRLLRLVQEAVRTAAGAPETPGIALAIERRGRLALTALITPLRATWDRSGNSAPAAMIFIRDPEEATPAQNTLRELYGLTRTEAAITAALVQGHGLAEVAALLHVSVSTIRSHLKTIFSKTGTHRQGQLVALVAHSVAALASHEQPPAG